LTQSVLQQHTKAAAFAAAAAAAAAVGNGARTSEDARQHQPPTTAAPPPSNKGSWDSYSAGEPSADKASTEPCAKPSAPAASCSVAQGAAAAAALAVDGWQHADLAAESAAGWRVAARQLLRGFAEPQLEAAYLRYMFLTTQWVDQLSAVFYPVFGASLFLQDGLPPLAAWRDPWGLLTANKVEVRFVAICAMPPLRLPVGRPSLGRARWCGGGGHVLFFDAARHSAPDMLSAGAMHVSNRPGLLALWCC
jgi:hypothetical protein